MAKRETKATGGSARVRRALGFAGGLAATALAVSFAWTVLGGALSPQPVALAIPILTARADLPIAPPLVPHRRTSQRNLSAKYAVSPTQSSHGRAQTGGGSARAAASASPRRTEASSAGVAAGYRSSLLHIESKSSRTRGRPELG